MTKSQGTALLLLVAIIAVVFSIYLFFAVKELAAICAATPHC